MAVLDCLAELVAAIYRADRQPFAIAFRRRSMLWSGCRG